jgi:PAS domain S-box-containing protein
MSDFAFLYSIDENGVWELKWLTDSFERLSGYHKDEYSRSGFLQRYFKPESVRLVAADRRLLIAGKRTQGTYQVITKDGTPLWLEINASPTMDHDSDRVRFVYGIARDITQRKSSEDRLRSLADDLVQTEERERRRMATFLHDVISQSVSLAHLKLHRWQNMEKQRSATLDEVRAMLQHVVQDAHTLTFDLCPPIIHELSLAEALAWQIEWMRRQSDVRIDTDFDGVDVRPSPEFHILLFRATRELIINAIKHAEAGHIRVSLQLEETGLRITVEDDGIGFPQSMARLINSDSAAEKSEGGFGLLNIRERLADFKTKLSVDSQSAKGSRVTIFVPQTILHFAEQRQDPQPPAELVSGSQL